MGFCKDLLDVELWKIIRTTEDQEENNEAENQNNGSATLENLRVALCAVLGFNYPWMKYEIEEDQERPKVNPNNIGLR